MPLYNVIADDWDGVPQGNNLYVRANSPIEAVSAWQVYYETHEYPNSVDEIPEEPKQGAIPWTDVPQVWVKP